MSQIQYFILWLSSIPLHICDCFLKDFTYLFLERREGREKERKRNIYVKETSISCHLVCNLTPGIKPATQTFALTGYGTNAILLCRMIPNQFSPSDQATYMIFMNWNWIISALGQTLVLQPVGTFNSPGSYEKLHQMNQNLE